MGTHLRIATRSSPLAQVQANSIAQALSPLPTEQLTLSTKGDRHLRHPLSDLGGDKGWFVKELEEALLSNKADIAVHCIKDMPVLCPKGLIMPVICQREHPWDVLVGVTSIEDLPAKARIGTASLRRKTQWSAQFPDHLVQSVRGNLQKRLARLEEGDFDALILAQAGLSRMKLLDLPHCVLPANTLLPAAGQGALGIQVRENDERVLDQIQHLHHAPTALCVGAERALIGCLEAGCQTPVAAMAEIKANDTLSLWGRVGSCIEAQHTGPFEDRDALVEAVYQDLLAQGAKTYLEQAQWQ